MPGTRNQRRPTFLWQGLLIMLPVIVLAVASLASLRLDEEAAEQAIRNKATANVQSLARALRLTADEDLDRYLNLQRDWTSDLRSWPGVRFGSRSIESNRSVLAHHPWDQAYSGIKLEEWAVPHAELLADGRQVQPPDFPAVPTPPQWFRDLSPEQRETWQKLRRYGETNLAPASWSSEIQAFIDSGVPPEAGQAARCIMLNPQDMLSQDARTESGLSFPDIACYRLLRANPLPMGEGLVRAVWSRVVEQPSFAAPALLELAEAQTNGVDPDIQEKVDRMRQYWNALASVRDWLTPLRRLARLQRWDASRNWACWTEEPSRAALALLTPGVFQNVGTNSEGVPVSGRGYTIRFVPRPVLEAIFSRALSENGFLIPEYAAAAVTVEGVPLAAGRLASASDKAILASARQEFGKLEVADASDFELSFHLVNRGQMLSAERRHARLFAMLIAATALTALAGLLAAWRAFRHQLGLNELKSNFVSSVSHELRAPIASVRLMSESLESGKIHDPRKQREYFGFIVQECRRLTALIENVLDFSRIEQGRQQYELEPTDVFALARETVRLMVPGAAEKGVGLVLASSSCQPASSRLEVEADGRALQQALVNLIDNAIKHSPSGAEVAVGIDLAPGGVGQLPVISDQSSVSHDRSSAISELHLWVQDHGPGIPPAEHHKIFERFYRRGSELRRETPGVGLGLSIVQHVVEAHGGRVTVRSAVGEGSRFILVLPLNLDNRKVEL